MGYKPYKRGTPLKFIGKAQGPKKKTRTKRKKKRAKK